MNIQITVDVEAGKENKEEGGVWGQGEGTGEETEGDGEGFAEQAAQHNTWPPSWGLGPQPRPAAGGLQGGAEGVRETRGLGTKASRESLKALRESLMSGTLGGSVT